MLPQIPSITNYLPINIVVNHNSKSSKSSTRWYQCQINYYQYLKAHTPKTFQSLHIYFIKVKNPPDGFCSRLLFASVVIIIFGGIFVHRLYRILKVQLKLIKVPTTDFERQKFSTRRENQNSSKPIQKARNKPPKGYTKNRLFVFSTISKYLIFYILSSRVESSEQIDFFPDG